VIPHVDHPSPHAHEDAPMVCTGMHCAAPLAGCSSGLFCVGCGQRHVAKERWGYADLKPSIYYVPA